MNPFLQNLLSQLGLTADNIGLFNNVANINGANGSSGGSFGEVLNTYSQLGAQSALQPDLFGQLTPESGNIYQNPDSTINSINQAAFNANNFLAKGVEGSAPSNADFADYFIDSVAGTPGSGNPENEAAFREYFSQDGDIQTLIENSDYNKGQLQGAYTQFNTDVVEPFNTGIGDLSKLSPVIGSLAGLQELSAQEAGEQGKKQKKEFINPEQHRVSPTRGLGLAKDGGNMHKQVMTKLPKNFTLPPINLSGTSLMPETNVKQFHLGGGVSYREPLGNYKEGIENRYYEGTNRVPIQAESGGKGKEEMLILPTLDLIEVNATKRHSQMESDEVTDYAPEGTYVASQFGNVVINKSEAKNIIAEVGIKPYDIFGDNPTPTQKTLGDIMPHEEMSPADVAREIKKTFKTVDRNTPFAIKTNEENRNNSMPYLQGLILLSETDKNRKGLVADIDKAYNPPSGTTFIGSPEAPASNTEDLPMFKDGGLIRIPGVPKAILPALIGPLIGLATTAVSGGVGLYMNSKNRKEAAEFRRIGEEFNAENTARQERNNAAGLVGTLAAIAAQDATVDGARLDSTFIKQQQDGVPQSLLDAQIARLYRNNNSATTQQQAPNFAAGIAGQTVINNQANDAANNLFFQDALSRVDRGNARRKSIEDIINQQSIMDAETSNKQRFASNAKLAGVGSAIKAAADTDSQISANSASTSIGLLGQQTGANMQLNSQQAQNVANISSGLQQFVPQLFPEQTPSTPTPRALITAPAAIGGIYSPTAPSSIGSPGGVSPVGSLGGLTLPTTGAGVSGGWDCILGQKIQRGTGASLGPC
jgi:hypothetical protein